MLATLAVVLPIFALVLAGWLARRLGTLGPHATAELNRFVVYLALPALLFDIVAHAKPHDVWQPGFALSFGISTMLVFGATVLVRLRRGGHLADATLDGLNAGYANTGFIGFPLAVAALGREALAPTLISTIITACMLFALAIVLIETGLQAEARRRRLVLKVGLSLLRNPLLVAPAIAAIFPAFGLAVSAPAERFLTLLGSAASPCALVALGLFLATERPASRQGLATASGLVAVKLVAHPAITGAVAVWIFGLKPPLAHAAILLAALPTGTGPFMLAEFYRREATLTARVVLFSTIASVVTTSLMLTLF